MPETVAVNVRNRSHRITASVVIHDDGRPIEGVLLAMGTVLGGWSFQVLDGCLRYVHNHLGTATDEVRSSTPIAPGPHELPSPSTAPATCGGRAGCWSTATTVGAGPIEHVTAVRYSITGSGITCGWEQGPPVGPGYLAPFTFGGMLQRVEVEILTAGGPPRDLEAAYAAIMSEQ